jgi:pimeloyl-ACP methyl ester carboxylesterase
VLLPALADRFHLVSFDYPGFGNTDMPDPSTWDYTFDHLAEVVEAAMEAIGFTGPMGLYMQDYGGPIGNRLIEKHPDSLSGRSSKTPRPTKRDSPRPGTASATCSGPTAMPTRKHLSRLSWSSTPPRASTPPGTPIRPRSPRTTGPDLFFLGRPHAHRVQLDLFYDYRTNAALHPAGRERLRITQPRTIIFWGQGDIFFSLAGGEAYLRDLPEATLIRLDSGYFAVEDNLETIATGIKSFYDQQVSQPADHLE